MFEQHTRKRRIAKARRDGTSLGNILVDLGYCTPDELRELVGQQLQNAPLLGELMLQRGLITADELKQALLRQQALRGEADPAGLRDYGAAPRLQALQDVADRLRRTANVSKGLAAKLSET